MQILVFLQEPNAADKKIAQYGRIAKHDQASRQTFDRWVSDRSENQNIHNRQYRINEIETVFCLIPHVVFDRIKESHCNRLPVNEIKTSSRFFSRE